MILQFGGRGHLIFSSPWRLLSEITHPLLEFMCFRPMYDKDDSLMEMVKGIIILHIPQGKNLWGSPSSLPSMVVCKFIQWDDRHIMECIVQEILSENILQEEDNMSLKK